jgi:hypothetical protein
VTWQGRAAAAVLVGIVAAGCAGRVAPGAKAGGDGAHQATRATGNGRPPVTVVSREGDARGAVAVAVTTLGIAPDRGATPGVALAALVEARVAAHTSVQVDATGGWDGWRLRALVASPAEASAFVEAVRTAMLVPVAADDAAMAAVARKMAALAARPLADRALFEVAQCTGEAFGLGSDPPVSAAELEAWRRSAHGLGRVAVATAGDDSLADAAVEALARAAPWPSADAIAASPWPSPDARPTVYDASGEVAPGAARVVVTVRTAAPERAVAAAPGLGEPRGPLATRLAALDAPAHVRSIVAAAHADGGCIAATLELSARDIGTDAPSRIATAAALARQELAVEVADAPAPADLPRRIATAARDPRDAAERAAWWALAGRRRDLADGELRFGITVGIASPRDAIEPVHADALVAEIDRATIAWHSPVVEARTRVERGQGEVWVVVGTPCGTLPEAAADAGAGAAVTTSAAMQATVGAGDVRVEPFVTTEGVGVIAHGPPHTGETPAAHARRLADTAARAFAADSLDDATVARARTALLGQAADADARALGALGAALAPGHPSWIEPSGTTFGLASASDEAVALRASAIRAGPLRVAVLAPVDEGQADAAARAVDRWVARRPGEARACPPLPSVPAARPGTYAVEVPPGGSSEALVAVPLAPGDEAARTDATWVAAALDGSGGLLDRALGADSATLARSSNASVLGAPRTSALVVRLVATEAQLDGAVAQTRALLDRLRQGALREEDRKRATDALEHAALTASLDPRARALAVWRGEVPSPTLKRAAPSLDELRAFAAAALHDDAFVIVAARPPRPGR